MIESLTLGGAEKSLVTLLNLMDYSKYDVDLLLFAQGGAFQKLLSKEVNLLAVPNFFAYNRISWISMAEKIRQPRKMIAQLRYSIALRMGKHNHIEKAVLLWERSRNCFKEMEQEYDVAIAYAQGVPTFFVAEKVKAKKKVAWINATYIPYGRYLNFITPMYGVFDYVNGVSNEIAKIVQSTFVLPRDKIVVIKDIIDDKFALRMAKMPSNVQKDMSYCGTKILTVGRFAAMKGYRFAIDAAGILKNAGILFKWYVIGEGELRKELEKQIHQQGLEEEFILLGSRSNPYPYFQACDLYVQTSTFEGFGITLAEAKLFDKPIVTTNFPAVSEQFTNEINSLIVDISAEGIANGIMRMLNDSELRERCIANVRAEKKGNPEEIEKLYRLIED